MSKMAKNGHFEIQKMNMSNFVNFENPKKSYQNPTKILPKSYQNPSKMLPKSKQNATKILQKCKQFYKVQAFLQGKMLDILEIGSVGLKLMPH